MSNILNFIAETNILNFTVFLLIIIAAVKKIDIPLMLEKLKEQIAENVNFSNQTKEKALNELKHARLSFENTDSEIKEIIDITNTNAYNLKENILFNAEEKINNLKINAEMLLENEAKTLNALLKTQQGKDALNMAQNHIIKEMKNNSDLQKKFIEYSIKEIDEVML